MSYDASTLSLGPTPVIVVAADPHKVARYAAHLRTRYGSEYDIEECASPMELVERIKVLKHHDHPIAMVGMSVNLGEYTVYQLMPKLREVCPTARRVVMVDTTEEFAEHNQSLIELIQQNVLDMSVVLPRGPRDEEFHVALTDVLSDWGWTTAAPIVPFVEIVCEGPSADRSRIEDFCQRMGMPYLTHAAESLRGQAILTEAGPDAVHPVVRLRTGQVMQRPSYAELGQLLNRNSAPLPDDYVADLAVIGSGPAGLAAAVYGASEGLATLVVEAEAVGGQAGTSSMIRNYLGFPRGISGMRLAQRARTQANRFGARFLLGNPATRLTPGDVHTIELADGTELRARSVAVATGASYRRLGVESVEDLVGLGVHYGAAMSVAQSLRGENVHVVGGGNSAGQAAMHLARFAESVTVLIRRDSLRSTMSDYLIREIENTRRITVRPFTEVVDAGPSHGLEWLRLRDVRSGEEEQVASGALLLLLGAEPNTGWLPGEIAKDPKGFILTGRDTPQELWSENESGPCPPEALATSLPGVYAVGDVRFGSMKRVASASGEGAAAVALVHSYLDGLAT